MIGPLSLPPAFDQAPALPAYQVIHCLITQLGVFEEICGLDLLSFPTT